MGKDDKKRASLKQASVTVPGVFATLFLTTPVPMQIPAGYYDAARQLYVSAATGEPAFVRTAADGKPIRVADTTGTTCTITTMTGKREAPDDHNDTVQDGFDEG